MDRVLHGRTGRFAAPGVVMTPDERRLREAEGLADLCSRAGAVCGRGLLAEVEHVTAQLRDALAVVDEVGARVHIQHDRAIRAEAALVDARAEVRRLRESTTELAHAKAKIDNLLRDNHDLCRTIADLHAELAAERAKVERVEAVRQIMLTSSNQSVCAWATTDLRAALTGGER